MPFLDRNGYRLHYRLSGPEGAPVLLLGNSIASDLTIWDEVAADLDRDFRVLRFDMPGHGESDPVPGVEDLAALALEPLALLDALDIEQAHLAGISLGAMVAAELALKEPRRCLSLIYCNAITEAGPAYAAMWRERIHQTPEGLAPIVESTLDRWLTADALAGLRRRTGEMILASSTVGFHAAATALTGLSLTDRLAELDVPKLFLAGEHDQAAPPEVMKAQAGQAGAAFTTFPGAAHLSCLEQPAALAGTMRGWMLRSL
ncbi:alpha/beta fold hydrolase [Paracoccus thiocyanatus]|uniref:AB hydrolase-1 domain-containing protein n=1 Tax=Paracoccus thiocyanatus TaxID=34006 RepID=A0A3D8PFA0_9RHOB|nr:alpha/beta fold hydrolase [Paracoccus thiocyanatus]RDW14766.1 hypothetical protein DIE28_01130 [Paracoccus thiocyanatus]